jgi:hypothetical protein
LNTPEASFVEEKVFRLVSVREETEMFTGIPPQQVALGRKTGNCHAPEPLFRGRGRREGAWGGNSDRALNFAQIRSYFFVNPESSEKLR